MAFYVSESLKGKITEEDFLNDDVETKSNFVEKFYLKIAAPDNEQGSIERICIPITSILQEEGNTVCQLVGPEDTELFRKFLLWVKNSNNVNLFMSNNADGASDTGIFSFAGKQIDIREVRQSLLGYNYLVTIVIHDCIVF